MEYLMTYGWAILIIAVVLGALFQLGVFNGATFAPKAPPGACQVFRPNGQGTAFDLNLEGVCNGELPEYVAQFNGQYGFIEATVTDIPTGTEQRTISAWVYPFDLADRGWIGYGNTLAAAEFTGWFQTGVSGASLWGSNIYVPAAAST